jgi:Rab family protein
MEYSAVKLVLLGETGVGKTSVVQHYISGMAPERVNPTIGAAFVTKIVTCQDKQLELLIWDTAGQEVYRGLAPMYYRSALIAIIVFDVTKRDSFEAVDYWIRELKKNVADGIIIMICGNKTDLVDRRIVDFQEASSFASDKGVLYAETSAMTGAGVESMFQIALSALLRQKRIVEEPSNNVKVAEKQKNVGKKGCC